MDAIDRILSKALDASMAKESALAANIANVDTPEYVRQDVDFEAEMQKIIKAEGQGDLKPEVMSQPGQPVKLENEVVEINKNTSVYSSVAKITALKMSILQASLGASQ
jgi:flagellar basal-body rod protein FlgB